MLLNEIRHVTRQYCRLEVGNPIVARLNQVPFKSILAGAFIDFQVGGPAPAVAQRVHIRHVTIEVNRDYCLGLRG